MILLGAWLNANAIKNHTHNKCTTPSTQIATISKSTHAAVLQAKHNTLMHALYGNRVANQRKKGYNFIHWNKGSSLFHNKTNEIAHILDGFKPHIFSISEANIDIGVDTSTYNIQGYAIEHSIAQHTGIARQALLIKDDINYTRRHDLENSDTCTVWVEIHTPNKKSFLVMGGYRQWQLPRTHPQHRDSGTVSQQYKRFQLILTQWALALRENKNTIVMMDDNIDTITSQHNARYNIQTLKNAYFRHTQSHNLVIHNNAPTRHMRGVKPSCIDHITSNIPQFVHNVKTHHTGASDHSILAFTYSTSFSTDKPLYRMTRDTSLLTPANMEHYIDTSAPLCDLFTQEDPNTVTNTLMTELNRMIDTLAPAHRVQLNKKHSPFIDTESLALINTRKEHYARARQTDTPEDWRQYRHTNNLTNRLLAKKKRDYLTNKFDSKNTNTMWTALKNQTGTNKQQQPTTIIDNSTFISSPRAIATLANKHYIRKINTIRSMFKNALSAVHILSTLIPRQKHTFSLPEITLAQTIKIIDDAQHSHSTGHDAISMHIIKQIKHKIAPHLTHMINCIIRTNTFPDTLKLSRITPILKPKKPRTQIDSFRPINNLCTLDKIVEQHIKTHLDTFINAHNIIHTNHHGGRRKHSTTTALAQIYNTLHTQYERGSITAVLQTDLSAAFDTVDTSILLDKLEHYGIRGNTLSLFRSYLTNRTQFVEVNTFKSCTLPSPQCSVIQGGKLSGTLYTLYTNEIPLLHKLMNTVHFDFLTCTPHKIHNEVEHTTVNFVDDSTNLITHKNAHNLTLYLTDFYTLLHAFYTINKLKINADKTELLVTCKPSLRHCAKTVTMHAHNHIIEQKDKTKILGKVVSNTLQHKEHINTIISTVNNRIHTLNQIGKYCTFKTRLLIANACIMSTLTHLLPLLINAHKSQLKKLQTLQLKSARLVLGNHCFKWSTARILGRCNWHSIYNLITEQSLILIHNTVTHRQPLALYQMLSSSMQRTQGRHYTRRLFMAHRAKTDQLNDSLLYKAVSLYNQLSPQLMALNTEQFRRKVKDYVHSTYPPDSIPARIQ